VLVVSSRGGVFVTEGLWGPLVDRWGNWGRWVQYHHVVTLGRRGELTSEERARQYREVERFAAKREQWRQETREYYLRNRTPQELYNFVWDELEDGEGFMLEALQAKARARGLQANASTWRRDRTSARMRGRSTILENAVAAAGRQRDRDASVAYGLR